MYVIIIENEDFELSDGIEVVWSRASQLAGVVNVCLPQHWMTASLMGRKHVTVSTIKRPVLIKTAGQ